LVGTVVFTLPVELLALEFASLLGALTVFIWLSVELFREHLISHPVRLVFWMELLHALGVDLGGGLTVRAFKFGFLVSKQLFEGLILRLSINLVS
jgi:hypothetical protein